MSKELEPESYSCKRKAAEPGQFHFYDGFVALAISFRNESAETQKSSSAFRLFNFVLQATVAELPVSSNLFKVFDFNVTLIVFTVNVLRASAFALRRKTRTGQPRIMKVHTWFVVKRSK